MPKFVGVKEVLRHNDSDFVYAFRKIRDVVIYTSATGEYFRITKDELWRGAQRSKIYWSLTNEPYANKRLVMSVR